MNKFWNFFDMPNQDGVIKRELRLDGEIASETWFGDEVTPKAFRDELTAGKGPLTVWINSPGGDCFAASQIYTMLKEYSDEVTVKIDGIAASAASVIAMAGDMVLMAPTSIMMIHNPLTMAFGNRDDMKQAIKMLDEVKESIVNAYELKTGLDRGTISRLMDNETWMNSRKALEMGFCDGIIGDCASHDDASAQDSYVYSHMTAVNKLIEKIVDTHEEQQEEPADDRVAISSLYDRLHQLI